MLPSVYLHGLWVESTLPLNLGMGLELWAWRLEPSIPLALWFGISMGHNGNSGQGNHTH